MPLSVIMQVDSSLFLLQEKEHFNKEPAPSLPILDYPGF